MDGFAEIAGLPAARPNGTGPNGAGLNGADPAAPSPVAAGPGLPALDTEQLEALRRRVAETTDSLRAIAVAFGLSQASLGRHVAMEGWTRPPGAPVARGGVAAGSRRLAASIADAGAVQARLLRAVDRQTAKIESKLTRKGAAIEEKDARILVHLARTLTTLMALDRDGGATANQPEPLDRERRNADLARRIERWAAGGDGSA